MKSSRAQSWSVAIGVTAAVHGGMIWVAMSAWGPTPTYDWVEPPAIELVAIQGGETTLDKGEAKPEPAQPPQKPKPDTPPPSPAAISVPAPKPTPISPVPTPQAAPAPSAPAPAAPASHPPVSADSALPPSHPPIARPAAPAPPQRSGEARGLNINAPRGKSQDYNAMLRVWIEAHKTYPKHARMRREEGVVTVSFAIDRNGRLLSSSIVRSSGIASLDDAALQALQRSNPFPPAPVQFVGDPIKATFPLGFELR